MAESESEPADVGVEQSTGKATKVLEFGLSDETYCLDIGVIDEIVDAGDLTRIPNSPPHVEGVMDLRGRTTSIINPKSVFDIEEDGTRERIIVFDPEAMEDQATVAWIVDEVYQVTDVTPDEVDQTTTADDENVHGIVKGDDKFVVWVDPDIVGDQ